MICRVLGAVVAICGGCDGPAPGGPPPEPEVPAIRGPAAVFPEAVTVRGTAGWFRADSLTVVPDTDLVAAHQGRSVAVVDVPGARVIWERPCRSVAFAGAGQVICAGPGNVTGYRAADGRMLWSRRGRFRAGDGDRVYWQRGDRLWRRDLLSGAVTSIALPDAAPPIRAACGDRFIAWDDRGTLASLRRRDDGLAVAWSRNAGAPILRVARCDEVATVIDTGSALRAIRNDTGEDESPNVSVTGWWPSLAGAGIETCGERGVTRRDPRLHRIAVLDSRCWGGPLLASGDGVRVLRAPFDTLLVVDDRGPRAWLGAPRATGPLAVVAGRLVTESLLLYELPPPRAGPAPIPLPEPGRATQTDLRPILLPEPRVPRVIGLSKSATRGVRVDAKHGLLAVAVAEGPLWLVDVERAQVRWAASGCRGVRAVAIADGAVLCAGRHRTAAFSLAGRYLWSRPPADAISVAGDRAVVRRSNITEVVEVSTARRLLGPVIDARIALVGTGAVATARAGTVSAAGHSIRFDVPIAAVHAAESRVLVALANGAMWTISPRDGASAAVGGWSSDWVWPTGSDLVFETVDGSPGETIVVAHDLRAGEQFRRAVPVGDSASIGSVRPVGSAVLVYRDTLATAVTPERGDLVAHFRSPTPVVAAVSMTGATVIGAGVTGSPLAVVIFE